MMSLPISAVPNQEFQAILDGNAWDLTIVLANGVMCMSLSLNNTVVIRNTLCVAGSLVIPSQYEEAGNFLFITANNELPDYTQFGITQSLVYISAAELVIYRTPPASPIIMAADFNPIAPLPQRFAPVGYVLS